MTTPLQVAILRGQKDSDLDRIIKEMSILLRAEDLTSEGMVDLAVAQYRKSEIEDRKEWPERFGKDAPAGQSLLSWSRAGTMDGWAGDARKLLSWIPHQHAFQKGTTEILALIIRDVFNAGLEVGAAYIASEGSDDPWGEPMAKDIRALKLP